MKIHFTLFLLIGCNLVSAQNSDTLSNHASLHFQIGLRVHDDTYIVGRRGGERNTLTSPLLGLMFQIPSKPLRFGVQVNFNVSFYTPPADSQFVADFQYETVAETQVGYQLHAYYDFRKWALGMGAYWERRENGANHEAPGFFYWKYYGVQASASIPLNWFDLEFRTRITLRPTFAALGSSQHSLLLLYNFDKQRLQRQNIKNLSVNILMGGRFFSTKNIPILDGEDLVPVGTSILTGIEFIHKKSGLSVNAERDWWLALNGGSFRREIKGKINTAFLSIGYHKKLKNSRYIRYKLGWSAIIDSSKPLTVNTPNVNKLVAYQVKGIGAAVSYELFKNTDVELRHTFPILGDRVFNPLRTSLGLIYRHNPSSKMR